MATSGAMSTSNQYIKYTITITEKARSGDNIANNETPVDVSVRFYRTNTGYETYGRGTLYCKIDGTTYTAAVDASDKITNSGIVLFTKSLNIKHNDDGSKKLTCSAWIDHSQVTSSEQGYNQDLSPIYRESTFGEIIGNTICESITININRKSSSFTHQFWYAIGNSGWIDLGKFEGASKTFVIADLCDQIADSTSGTMQLCIRTFNGSSQVGSDVYKNIDVKVPGATVPSFPNGDVIIGGGNPITTNAKSKNFSHLITYKFKSKSGNVNADKVKSGIVWWTPYDLASAIPRATSAQGYIVCETYNGAALVGTSEQITFTAIVPDNSTTKPSFNADGFNLTPESNLPSEFSGLYIQGKTKVKSEFEASSAYSTISDYKMSVEGRVYTGNPATSYVLSKDGNIEVIGTVTDARGYSTQVAKEISVIPYSIPSITPCDGDREIICERSNQDGEYTPSGTYLHIRAKVSCSPIIADGVQKNFCKLKYRYKTTGGDWSSEKELLSLSNASSNTYEGIIPDVVTETDKTYLVQLIIEDTVGESISYDFPISTDKVTLHLGYGGHGVAVGKYSEATPDNEMFESEWDAKFYGDLYASHISKLDDYDGKDFNELIHHSGYYASFKAPSTAECSNYPSDKTGVLEVISAMKQNATTLNWWGFAYQTYKTHEGDIFTRSYYSDRGWTEWKKL